MFMFTCSFAERKTKFTENLYQWTMWSTDTQAESGIFPQGQKCLAFCWERSAWIYGVFGQEPSSARPLYKERLRWSKERQITDSGGTSCCWLSMNRHWLWAELMGRSLRLEEQVCRGQPQGSRLAAACQDFKTHTYTQCNRQFVMSWCNNITNTSAVKTESCPVYAATLEDLLYCCSWHNCLLPVKQTIKSENSMEIRPDSIHGSEDTLPWLLRRSMGQPTRKTGLDKSVQEENKNSRNNSDRKYVNDMRCIYSYKTKRKQPSSSCMWSEHISKSGDTIFFFFDFEVRDYSRQ